MKTMQFFGKTLGLILACGLTVACTNDDDFAAGTTTADGGVLQFNVVDAGVASSSVSAKATTDTNYKTVFEKDDVVGLIAVKNGAIIDSISNIQLVYNGSSWEPSKDIRFNSQLKDVYFYAYTPYNKDIITNKLFDPASTTPFAEAVKACTWTADQSTKAAYQNVDMMYSKGFTLNTETTAAEEKHTVTLTMGHALSLISVELPCKSYSFSNADSLSTYTYSQATNASFLLDGSAVKPYVENGRYNFIVKPQDAERSLEVNFKNGTERYMKLTIVPSGEGGLNEGQYAKFRIDGGQTVTPIELHVGDFYMKDGTIVAKGTTLTDTQKANVVGVVYSIGTSEEVKKVNSSWAHAMVVAPAEYAGPWSTTDFTSENEGTWYQAYTDLIDIGKGGYSLSGFDKAESGYSQTAVWEKIAKDHPTYYDGVKTQQSACPVCPSSLCTGWYVPSCGDWKVFWQNWSSNSEAMTASMKAADGTAYAASTAYYTSSCGSNAGTPNKYFIYRLSESNSNQFARSAPTTSTIKIRFILAF